MPSISQQAPLPNRFFIYSRKSVCTGRGESVENQVEMCRQYIEAKFPGAARENIFVYEDEGFSAKNTDRPRFQQMLRDIPLKRPGYIVCYRLDRISRSVSDFSALIEELNRRGISFICIREEFDTSHPMGKAMMYIASVFAQLERETISERVRDNMRLLARSGRWLGGTPPTGYRTEQCRETLPDGRVRLCCRLTEQPDELKTVLLLYQKFPELGSLSALQRALTKQGIRSRSGKPFSVPGIRQILQNPVYCTADREALDYFTRSSAQVCFTREDCGSGRGLIAYSKRDYRQRRAPRQEMGSWILAAGQHRGLIPGRQWIAVQKLLAESAAGNGSAAHPHNEYALLSGRIRCTACGSVLLAKRRTGTAGGSFGYICKTRLRSGASACSCPGLSGPQTDEAVWQALLPWLTDCESPLSFLKPFRKELSRALKDLPDSPSLSLPQQEELHRIARQLAEPKALLSLLSMAEKRQLLELLIDGIDWDGAALRIHLRRGTLREGVPL